MKFKMVDKTSIVYQLQELVWQAGKKFDQGLKLGDVQIEHPENEGYGDYASNFALAKFEALTTHNSQLTTPLDLAQFIARLLKEERELRFANTIEKIEVAPPGFINFWLSKEYLMSQIEKIIKEKDGFGKLATFKGKKMMVEFAHPNTHKLFHLGHLRNISLGESIVRILEANGAEVVRANYQGDVGLHIAKCLYGILQTQNAKRKTQNYNSKLKTLKTLNQKIEFLGKAYVQGNKAYEEDENAKQEIIKINEQIYNQDPKIMPLWQKTRQWSLDYFDRIYKRVDSKFDRFYFESEMVEGKEMAQSAVEKGILKKSEGAIIFDGKKYGLDIRVFVNALGFPTYEAKELKLAELELAEFGKIDQCLHVVGPEQISFFKVTFKAEELLNPEKFKGKQHHLVYGWVRLKRGKMSSRAGKVVLAEWLIDEVKKRLLKEFKMSEEVGEKVAVGAVKYSFLKVSPRSEIAFDIDESINMEGDSGPYLQYTYARCRSVLRKADDYKDVIAQFIARSSRELKFANPEEMAILRTIYKFPEVVGEAGQNYAPNLICNFLFDLAQKFNGFYNKHRILQQGNKATRQQGNKEQKNEIAKERNSEIRTFRLALTQATAQVIKNGLYLLGIKVLEKM